MRRARDVLEVEGDARQAVAGERVGDDRDRAAYQLRVIEQPGEGASVEVVAGEIRDHGEDLYRLLGTGGFDQHTTVHPEPDRHGVRTRSHESPFRHDPVERVDVTVERG